MGAPLTHDFAVISLSDRLTPWETIEKRLTHAAKADLTIALYNPASRSRPAHLKRACDILLRDLPDSRLCGIARNIGRAVIVSFLVGSQNTVVAVGTLQEVGNDYITLFHPGRSAYITAAIYSIRFVEFPQGNNVLTLA